VSWRNWNPGVVRISAGAQGARGGEGPPDTTAGARHWRRGHCPSPFPRCALPSAKQSRGQRARLARSRPRVLAGAAVVAGRSCDATWCEAPKTKESAFCYAFQEPLAWLECVPGGSPGRCACARGRWAPGCADAAVPAAVGGHGATAKEDGAPEGARARSRRSRCGLHLVQLAMRCRPGKQP